ncbi:MAG TPA: cupin domain-containing protein [Acidimicrobiia bacterium]|jgi:quercetin dioxygenase-like cupin family protein
MGQRRATKVNIGAVETAQDLREDEGWIEMLVQFLITEDNAGSEEVVFGRTVFRPGSKHEWHRHENAEEVQFLLSGEGIVLDGDAEIPVVEGDVVFTPKGQWHGFRNTSDVEDAVVIWLWAGAGSRDAAGYEARSMAQGTP